jgi:hypothetical protein
MVFGGVRQRLALRIEFEGSLESLVRLLAEAQPRQGLSQVEVGAFQLRVEPDRVAQGLGGLIRTAELQQYESQVFVGFGEGGSLPDCLAERGFRLVQPIQLYEHGAAKSEHVDVSWMILQKRPAQAFGLGKLAALDELNDIVETVFRRRQ